MTSAVKHPSYPQAQKFISALASHQFTAAENVVAPSQRSRFSAQYLQARWMQMEKITGKPTAIVLDEVEISANITIGNRNTSPYRGGKGVKYTYALTGIAQREAQIVFTMRQYQGRWMVTEVIFAF